MGSSGTVYVFAFVVLVSVGGHFAASMDGNSLVSGSQFWSLHPQPAKRNAVQLCGYRLVEAVRGICKGHIFSGFNRRSDAGAGGHNEELMDFYENSNSDMGSDPMSFQYNTLDSIWDKDSDNTWNDLELLWPHTPKSLALKVLTEGKSHQRIRRTISDECCKKPCSLTEMAKYCGGRSKRSMALTV